VRKGMRPGQALFPLGIEPGIPTISNIWFDTSNCTIKLYVKVN
jgi:hypothetical protein